MASKNKRIKNEQWYVHELISKIDNQEINKPQFQRKRKWDITPQKENVPNERSYIEFLFKKKNSVHAITFGQETKKDKVYFTNIDGNNRINAIKHFMEKPFEIFREYLDDLFKILETNKIKNTEEIKNIFSSLSYISLLSIKRPDRFFKSIGKSELFNEIKHIQNDIDDEIEKIPKILYIKGETNRFDVTVIISVTIFEGYNTDELCETFEEINKYNSKLTETELMSCRLYNVNDFIINDNVFKTSIENSIKDYYENKSKGEVLDCYTYDPETDDINAHDFIVGYQNLCNNNYKFIDKTDSDGLSLYFKLWKALYGNYEDTFNSKNVNDFIYNIDNSCKILKKTFDRIFTDQINEKLFNKSCLKKLTTLKKNNLFILICSIIGYKNKGEIDDKIIKYLEICIIYHFFTSDIKDKDKRNELKVCDILTYTAGGAYIRDITKKILSEPDIIINDLNDVKFNDLLDILNYENNNPYKRKFDDGKPQHEKRRPLKFFEKTIMFYFYKEKMPTNMLENKFSIEHIFPNSCDWDDELDKDRTGNLLPIISSINNSRGNKHINNYTTTIEGEEFFKFIKDIIPSYTDYDKIIKHDRKPIIINNDLYNNKCKQNETIYKECIIKCLFDDI